MSGIDYFAWVVLIVIIVSVVGCFIGLAKLPGDMARAKGHPQASDQHCWLARPAVNHRCGLGTGHGLGQYDAHQRGRVGGAGGAGGVGG